MPPRGWTTPEEFAFLQGKIAEYLTKKAEGRLWRFWPTLFEEWFEHFPEEAQMGLLGIVPSQQQDKDAGEALLKRKAKRAPVRRVHRPIELFQKRNGALVDEGLEAEGFFDMNEVHFSATLAGWADESDEEQKACIKAAQVERMKIRTRGVDKLFAEASDDELRCIAELIEEEEREFALMGKGGKKGLKMQQQKEAGANTRGVSIRLERTPEEYQLAIDESPEVLARVHKVLARRTGWYGITIYGGPNPRFGGGLSMKTVCFGRTLAGNDFETAHGTFDESISKYFQAFLKRSFPTEVRRARALQQLQLEETVDATLPALDGLFRMPNEPVVALAPVREKAKRVRKKAAKKSTTSTSTVAPAAPASESSPESAVTTSAGTPVAPLLPSTLPNSSPPSEYPAHPLQPPYDDPFADNDNNLFHGSVDTNGGFDDGYEMDNEATLPWPAGMGPPSSPTTAEANTNAERGGAHGATYVQARPPASPPIDPVLLDNQRTGRNAPRPTWKGTESSSGGAPASPTPRRSLGGLINRFHQIMGDPPVVGATPRPASSSSGVNTAPALGSILNKAPALTFALSQLIPNSGPARASLQPPAHAASSAGPARISRISSTTAGAALAASSGEPPSVPPPFMISSRPMANDPNPAKAAPAPAKGKKGNERGGRKKGIAAEAATKEGVAKIAAKAVTKMKATTKRGRNTSNATAAALDDTTNLDAGQSPTPAVTDSPATAPTLAAPPAADSAAPASPTLIYTTTNNSARYARAAHKAEQEKKAKDLAERKERARVHNPDGPTDLVILPAPGRVQRSRKAAKNFDGSVVEVPKKMLRAEQMAKRNEPTENALLARTGRKRAAEDEVPITTTRASKSKTLMRLADQRNFEYIDLSADIHIGNGDLEKNFAVKEPIWIQKHTTGEARTRDPAEQGAITRLTVDARELWEGLLPRSSSHQRDKKKNPDSTDDGNGGESGGGWGGCCIEGRRGRRTSGTDQAVPTGTAGTAAAGDAGRAAAGRGMLQRLAEMWVSNVQRAGVACAPADAGAGIPGPIAEYFGAYFQRASGRRVEGEQCWGFRVDTQCIEPRIDCWWPGAKKQRRSVYTAESGILSKNADVWVD
ncbi:hypothetical protein C8R43DRAFT_959542 [Mycena crocata]|nr:hypothetical protein C8R43DRAFT_959542 [Mycena crocata]